MASPISVDLPHRLGQEEAKRRIDGGIDKLTDFIPGGGGADVRSSWSGDRLSLQVNAMGQTVDARIDVREALVHVEVVLPPALAFFAKPLEQALHRSGQKLLEGKPAPPRH